MNSAPIGLIAAMPDEIKPLLRRISSVTKEKRNEITLYRFKMANREICLVESGMGVKNAARAAGLLISAVRPAVIVNFGFGGAVTEETDVGDIILADRLLYARSPLFSEQRIDASLAAAVVRHLMQPPHPSLFRVNTGTVITTAEITNKQQLRTLLPAGVSRPVVDMETSAIAQAAAEAVIPLIAVRAISDGAREELGFSLDEFTDQQMNIRIWKVLVTICKRPGIIPQLLRLARNSRMAGDRLAWSVLTIVEVLDKIVNEREA